ncbi:hypothetical protein [Streptomyces sp. NPDC048196]|uniref:hypothetical protein n=1 Tax=Streptomyces sp. NPDC048196 TaxID=3154712 RepID=UPI0033F6AD0B
MTSAKTGDRSDDRAYGTGLLRTAIRPCHEGGWLWSREPGPQAPQTFAVVPPSLTTLLTSLGDGGPDRLAPARHAGSTRHYQVTGNESLAARLLNNGPTTEAETSLLRVGALLARLHRLTPPSDMPSRRPAGLDRLAHWLSNGAGFGPARELLRKALGEVRWGVLGKWCSEVVADSRHVLSHGSPSLGATVMGAAGVELLTGEDVCMTPWYVDVGWVAGELVELAWQQGGDHKQWQVLLSALYSGYGRDLGNRWNRAAALRTALHLHDFSTYVAWRPQDVPRYAGFLSFLIDL